MRLKFLFLVPFLIAAYGCGTSRWSDTGRTATEQILLSDAMDRAVSKLDFRALAGKTVFLDTTYIKTATDWGYLVSAMRQHMLASGCVLREQKDEADYIIEIRANAIGTNRHELLVGVPATELTSIVPFPGVPRAIPEMPFLKRTEQRGVAKIAVFAYNRTTGRPVWQSGAIPVESNAKDLWVLGAGPFQRGTIYDGTKFVGDRLNIPLIDPMSGRKDSDFFSVTDEAYFSEPVEPEEEVVDTSEPESTAEAKVAPAPAQSEAPAPAQAQAEAKDPVPDQAPAQAETSPATPAHAETPPTTSAPVQAEALPKAPRPSEAETLPPMLEPAAARVADKAPVGDGQVSPVGYAEAVEAAK